MVGTEEILMPAMEAGADGSVCGGANMFPELFVKLYQAIIDNQRSQAKKCRSMWCVSRKPSTPWALRKRATFAGSRLALAELGVCGDTPAEPFGPFSEEERARIAFSIEPLVAGSYLKGSTMQTFRAAVLAALTLFYPAALSFGQVNATGTFSGQVTDATRSGGSECRRQSDRAGDWHRHVEADRRRTATLPCRC